MFNASGTERIVHNPRLAQQQLAPMATGLGAVMRLTAGPPECHERLNCRQGSFRENIISSGAYPQVQVDRKTAEVRTSPKMEGLWAQKVITECG